MVTIYTDRGPASEVLEEEAHPFQFGRLTAVALGAALLLSLIASLNLSNDVKDLDNRKIPFIQHQIAQTPVAQQNRTF